MKSITKIIFAAALLFGANQAIAANYNEPLVMVRFDNPYVQYQKSLSMAVGAAVKTKPDVVFDVLAGAGALNAGQQIAGQIVSLGVSPSNVNLRQSGYNNNEVLVFVR